LQEGIFSDYSYFCPGTQALIRLLNSPKLTLNFPGWNGVGILEGFLQGRREEGYFLIGTGKEGQGYKDCVGNVSTVTLKFLQAIV